MPRPQKPRKVCAHPTCTHFEPRGNCKRQEVAMTVDEYECIRLIDWENMTQEQCAQQMEVARTTVQAIYASARKKLSQCLVLGHRLVITGGEYQLCDGQGDACEKKCCRRHAGQYKETGETTNV